MKSAGSGADSAESHDTPRSREAIDSVEARRTTGIMDENNLVSVLDAV